MSGKITAWLLMALFFMGNTALAANWTYLQRLEGTRYGACTEYVDADSVIRAGDKLVYWTMWVVDADDNPHQYKKLLWQNEALLGETLQSRKLASYFYDKDDREIFRHLQPGSFYTPPQESEMSEGIRRAAFFAKAGQESQSAKPDDLLVEGPKWHGAAAFPDGDLYWDVHSIVAWPPVDSEIIEVIMRWDWNKKGVAARKAALAAVVQKPRPTDYEDLRYTVAHYQFSIKENKVKVLSYADYDSRQRRITFLDGGDWQTIAAGAPEEAARKIALQWFLFDTTESR